MIRYKTEAVCDNCEFVLVISNPDGERHYSDNWLTGLTYDVCESCAADAPVNLKKAVRKRILGEQIIKEASEVMNAGLEAK